MIHKKLLSLLIIATFSCALSALRAEEQKELYPLGVHLKVLEKDLSNPEYQEVLKSMIFTDLWAEWKRVGTPDNYVTFLNKHGGLEKVKASPALKAAYERRKKIADEFLKMVSAQYFRVKKRRLYKEKELQELLKNAADVKKEKDSDSSVSIEVILPTVDSKAHWPRLRGPNGQGNTYDTDIPLHWNDKENILWKSPITGKGNSSPVVWGDRIFITAASENGKSRIR